MRLQSASRTSIAKYQQFAHSDGSTVAILHRLVADVSPFLDREWDQVTTYGSDDFTPCGRFDACEIFRNGAVSAKRPVERGGPSTVGKSGA